MTQKAMAELFGVDKSSISRHLKNIFETGELEEKVVVAKIETTTQHGAIAGKHVEESGARIRPVQQKSSHRV